MTPTILLTNSDYFNNSNIIRLSELEHLLQLCESGGAAFMCGVRVRREEGESREVRGRGVWMWWVYWLVVCVFINRPPFFCFLLLLPFPQASLYFWEWDCHRSWLVTISSAHLAPHMRTLCEHCTTLPTSLPLCTHSSYSSSSVLLSHTIIRKRTQRWLMIWADEETNLSDQLNLYVYLFLTLGVIVIGE